MNRRKPNFFIVRYQCLGAVAVVRIEIPDRDPFNLPCSRGPWPRFGVSDAGYNQSVQCRDCYIAKIAKTHRAIAHGMMTGWPHQTKGAFRADGCARRFNRRPRCLPRKKVDVRIGRRVEIEILVCFRYPQEMLARMRTQQFLITGRARFVPLPVTMPTPQQRNRRQNPFRPFRMARPAILGAA